MRLLSFVVVLSSAAHAKHEHPIELPSKSNILATKKPVLDDRYLLPPSPPTKYLTEESADEHPLDKPPHHKAKAYTGSFRHHSTKTDPNSGKFRHHNRKNIMKRLQDPEGEKGRPIFYRRKEQSEGSDITVEPLFDKKEASSARLAARLHEGKTPLHSKGLNSKAHTGELEKSLDEKETARLAARLHGSKGKRDPMKKSSRPDKKNTRPLSSGLQKKKHVKKDKTGSSYSTSSSE